MVARLRVIEGRPWREAVISAMAAEAPYRPWQFADLEPGDSAIVVVDTDPRTVLCAFTVDPDHDVRDAIAQECRHGFRTLRAVPDIEQAADRFAPADWAGTPADSPAALALLDAIGSYEPSMPLDREGTSSAAAGRILLESEGRCTCCGKKTDLARDPDGLRARAVAVGDIESGRDWPAALCAGCSATMDADGFTSVVDFMMSPHPACPFCSARKTRKVIYGRMTWAGSVNLPPWFSTGGCVVGEEGQWLCGACQYSWDPPSRDLG